MTSHDDHDNYEADERPEKQRKNSNDAWYGTILPRVMLSLLLNFAGVLFTLITRCVHTSTASQEMPGQRASLPLRAAQEKTIGKYLATRFPIPDKNVLEPPVGERGARNKPTELDETRNASASSAYIHCTICGILDRIVASKYTWHEFQLHSFLYADGSFTKDDPCQGFGRGEMLMRLSTSGLGEKTISPDANTSKHNVYSQHLCTKSSKAPDATKQAHPDRGTPQDHMAKMTELARLQREAAAAWSLPSSFIPSRCIAIPPIVHAHGQLMAPRFSLNEPRTCCITRPDSLYQLRCLHPARAWTKPGLPSQTTVKPFANLLKPRDPRGIAFVQTV
ncbi:hypothetical protein GGX14DRAFT_392433 [Mycena pura]|uniref:Uncharacterized protein n=1 Tax=Mycena pura TaxID=153505 RepID=A0AAD6VKN6_9AGAR|nr:hypothetical protein GGX14DRAFT_392433 [Mycena pura]